MRRLILILALALPAHGQILQSISANGSVQAAATPTFSPPAGAVSNPTTVTLSTTSDTCSIYIHHNTTGSPIASDPTGTYSVTGAITLYGKVIGCPGYQDSAVGSAAYTISGGAKIDTPTDAPGEGAYSGTKSVSLTCPLSSTCCYTTDGSTPAASTPGTCSAGSTYSTAFNITSTHTLKVLATKSGMTNSDILNSDYTIGTVPSACSNTDYLHTWTCVQNKEFGQTGANVGTTPTTATMISNTGSGHQVIMTAIWCANSGCSSSALINITMTPSDGASDACWTGSSAPGLPIDSATHIGTGVWVCPNVGVTQTFSITASGSASSTVSYVYLMVSEWTGGATSSIIDVAGSGSNSSGTAASATTSTAATNATDLVFGFLNDNDNNSMTAGDGFGIVNQGLAGAITEVKSVTSVGGRTANSTWTGSTGWQAAVVMLKHQ